MADEETLRARWRHLAACVPGAAEVEFDEGEPVVPRWLPASRITTAQADYTGEPGWPGWFRNLLGKGPHVSDDDIILMGLEARLARLETDRDQRATSWLRRAASEHHWKDPDTAPQVIPPGVVADPADARRRVHEFTQERPYFVTGGQPETEAEATRRFGQELLDGLEGGGRR